MWPALNRSMDVLSRNLLRKLEHVVERSIYGRLHSALLERSKHLLRGDVAHQFVLRERAATQAAKSGIKSPAASIVRGQDFFTSVFRPAVQVHSDFEITVFGQHGRNDVANLLGRRH